MTDTKNILLVGVGGQGTILASNLLTIGLADAGYDVKMSEIHGMSQRGGSVSSQVRFGSEVQSPVIEKGTAHLLVSFETMEALRWLPYLAPGGKVVANDYRINPMPVNSGMASYADDILAQVQAVADTTVIKAMDEAEALGSSRVMNSILLGATIKSMGLTELDWDRIVRENVKPAFIDLNIAAIHRGMDLV